MNSFKYVRDVCVCLRCLLSTPSLSSPANDTYLCVVHLTPFVTREMYLFLPFVTLYLTHNNISLRFAWPSAVIWKTFNSPLLSQIHSFNQLHLFFASCCPQTGEFICQKALSSSLHMNFVSINSFCFSWACLPFFLLSLFVSNFLCNISIFSRPPSLRKIHGRRRMKRLTLNCKAKCITHNRAVVCVWVWSTLHTSFTREFLRLFCLPSPSLLTCRVMQAAFNDGIECTEKRKVKNKINTSMVNDTTDKFSPSSSPSSCVACSRRELLSSESELNASFTIEH